MAKKNYYAVARGYKPGIYRMWHGFNGAKAQVIGFYGARFKGFVTRTEAEEWYAKHIGSPSPFSGGMKGESSTIKSLTQFKSELKKMGIPIEENQTTGHTKLRKVVIYTDGGCSNNPGPGGYGVVRVKGNNRKEYSGGFRKTTNNRMELMACIVGLRSLKSKRSVTLYSDSKYVVDGIEKGWAERWKAKGWMRTSIDKAENADLWSELLELCEKHEVTFKWVKGHAGNSENERCDKLAMKAMSKKGLPPDSNYEAGKTRVEL